jgi:hypothetical protein
LKTFSPWGRQFTERHVSEREKLEQDSEKSHLADPLPTGAFGERSFRLSISEFPYFRRRRPDRHGRTRGFAGGRRRVGAQQIGDPLEGGEHALVLFGRRRRLGAVISSGGSALGGNGSAPATGRRWMLTGATGLDRTSGERGCRSAPVAGLVSTGCG